jgi:EAL and modified HD-GYP domain-containing signal transduction protein
VVGVAETLVGRQPIFGPDLSVTGYELLFRRLDAPGQVLREEDGGYLTPEGLLGSTSDGIGSLVGTKRAFCNATASILLGEIPVHVPPDRVVIEVGPALIGDRTGLAGCRRLIDDGFTLAIDDLQGIEGAEDLLELASIVKVNTDTDDRERLTELVARCRTFNVDLIAQNVDTPATLGMCEVIGFDSFQGYLLAHPHEVSGGPLIPGRLAGLRVAARLLDAECPISIIEDVVRSDPAMSFQLLQLAGVGAASGMKRTVRTLREALIVVGWRRLQSWVALLLLNKDSSASEEAIATVLIRARMSELLAAAAGCQPDTGYTAGLLSALNIVLSMSAERIVGTLPLDAELRGAVLRGEGLLGHLISDVADYQLGRPQSATRSALSEDALRAASVEALTWTVGMTAVLDPGEGT